MNCQSSILDDGKDTGAARANETQAWLLYRGVRSILRCDEAEAISGIARFVVSQHSSLRILSSLIERTRQTPVPAVIALVRGLRSFLAVHSIRPTQSGARSDGAAWIARLGNDRRAIE